MLMFVAMLSPSTSAWLLRSSGAQPDPGRDGRLDRARRAARMPSTSTRARVALAGTEDRLEDLGAARADEPREADDLAGAHVEA